MYKRDESFYFIDLLKKYDTKHYKQWTIKEYYMYMNYKEYAKAERLLLQNAKKDRYFKKLLADFYLFRNKLKVTRKFYPEALLTVYIMTTLQLFNRIRRGQWQKAKLITQILCNLPINNEVKSRG